MQGRWHTTERGIAKRRKPCGITRKSQAEAGACTGVEVFFFLPLHCRFAIGTLSLLHCGAAMRQEMSGNFGIMRT